MMKIGSVVGAIAAGVLLFPGHAAAAVGELEKDYQTATTSVDEFWAQTLPKYGIAYVSPRNEGVVTRAIQTACGPAKLDNGGYCPADHSVIFGAELVSKAAERGDAFLYLLVAHEWGHAVQAQLPDRLVANWRELQADCLAGGALRALVASGVLVLENGDLSEMIGALIADGDPHDWQQNRDHGSSAQRVEYFTVGWNGGINACFQK